MLTEVDAQILAVLHELVLHMVNFICSATQKINFDIFGLYCCGLSENQETKWIEMLILASLRAKTTKYHNGGTYGV